VGQRRLEAGDDRVAPLPVAEREVVEREVDVGVREDLRSPISRANTAPASLHSRARSTLRISA
jgi:hypothetical protein